MQPVIYKNATIISPYDGDFPRIGDVAVQDGYFIAPSDASCNGARTIDATGCILCPAFTDLHTHLREPGQTAKETIETASAAALAGGYTTLVAMPNTNPPIDTPERFLEYSREWARRSPLHIIQTAAISMGRNGNEATDIAALKAAGVIALSDDGSTPQSDAVMHEIATRAAACDLPVIDHCENTALSRPGVMHEGAVSQRLGLPGQPREAELSVVRRDIELSRQTGARFHLQHLSCAESMSLLAQAHREGLPVTGEVTPHHLSLTDDAVILAGPNAKMAPPLREESDRQALIRGIFDGTVSCIATDHAPHTAEEKAQGMLKAPFGIIGLEYAFQICHAVLCIQNHLPIERLIHLFTKGPRDIIGLPPQHIAPGEQAEFVLIRPGVDEIIRVADGKSKSHNCPYDGMHVFCNVTFQMVQG